MDLQPRTNIGRIPGMDGLRAAAILGILLYHMFPDAVRGGYLGVNLFFVLSGFLLARSSLAQEARGGFSAGDFYQRRVRRIYPALLWTLGLTLLSVRLLLPAALSGLRGETASVLFGYQNWRLILRSQDYFTRVTASSPLTHLWFLAVLLQFYLVWPLIFGAYRLEKREGDARATTALLFALALFSAAEMALLYYLQGDAARVYYGTDTRVHALLLGAAIGLLPQERRRLPRGAAIALFSVCAAAMLALMILLDGKHPYVYEGLLPLTALLSAALVSLCAREDLPFGRALERKPVVWFGQRSYEIYLCMIPVLFLFERLRPTEDPVYLHLLEAGVILLAASLIHELARPGRWLAREGQASWRCFTRPAFWAMLLAMAVGVWSLAPEAAASRDLGTLERQLARNRAAIEAAAAGTPAPRPKTDSANVTMVGDSVMLGALPALQKTLPGCTVDAKVSRQVWDTPAVLDALEEEGRLGPVVVLALGTNGTFAPEQGQALIDRLGPERHIYWVTAYGSALSWQNQSNETISALAKKNANVTLIDWASLAPGHEAWFWSDGIHLQTEGQLAYAELIAEEIGCAPPAGAETPPVVYENGIAYADP